MFLYFNQSALEDSDCKVTTIYQMYQVEGYA